MASKTLKGLTIEIGGDTTKLGKALDDVEKQGRNLSSELGQINKLLKLDPKNTELLAQKQKVLADAIKNTESKLDTLKEAEKQVQAQFERGEVSEEQYRALQREIIATENKLDKYKNAAKETAEAERKLADGADKAGKELDDQADKTREADRATEDLDDSAGDLAAGGLAAVTAAAAAAVAAVVALAEESRQYRTEMAKLDTAFTDAGYSTQAATKTYEALQSVIGETEQAVEAANHLAKLASTEEELAEWTDILTGVYGTFGVSLPIEGLTEAANETKRVGQVTGPLADALNWAAKEGETFGVTLKKNTKANEEWNKKVKEAASAEDYFNLALEECSDEQERQQLITKTLTKLYGSAADQYKKTNAEVIRSNQATEKWNKATAKIGKTVDPVVTDIKELGVALLEDASEPLEDTAEFIQKKVIPAIKNVSSWVKSNGPLIKSTLTTVAAGMVAYKAATIATTVAHKGLKGAIASTTVAQKALNLVQKATPWGLVATGVTAVVACMAALHNAQKNARMSASHLTEEEQELIKKVDEAAEAFREQHEATEEAFGNISTEMTNVQNLADELKTLADESGRVKEKDQARADLILGRLNEALGTEYKQVGGLITGYDDLKKSIDQVILSKTANALLEAANADYVAAVQQETDAYNAKNLALEDYQEQLAVTKQAEADKNEAYLEWVEAIKSGRTADIESANARYMYLLGEWELEDELLTKKKSKYEEEQANYDGLRATIENYEKAQEEALKGNYQTAIDIFGRKGELYTEHANTVDEETAKVLATLQKEAEDAAVKAKLTKENFEKGVAGYTEEMVTEAETAYQEALGKFGSAYSDAYGLGEDFGQGLADGIKIKNGAVGAAAIAQIREAVKAAKKEAEINSPSKKTMAIGEGLGEGAEVGIEKKTPDVKRSAKDQVAAVIDAYQTPASTGQQAFRNIADQQAARYTAAQTATNANGPMLERILAAIEKGQVLTLDGDALVGATADRMDNALGRRRALAARGAT